MKYLYGFIAFALTACSAVYESPKPYLRLQPQTGAEIEYIKSVFNTLQPRSFDENVEYCGYIGVDENGRFIRTDFTRGTQGSCEAELFNDTFRALASFHTHGAFSENYDSEIPSFDDLKADILEGLDGYVATPGGRLWYNNAQGKEARLICGERCLISDADYKIAPELPVDERYSLEDLESFLED